MPFPEKSDGYNYLKYFLVIKSFPQYIHWKSALWKKTMSILWREKLYEQFIDDKAQLEKDMDNKLDMEWDKSKDQIRKEWETQI